MLRQLAPSVLLFAFLTLLLGLAYPLAMTEVSGVLFPRQAHGSLVEKDGQVIGSELIAQGFERPEYFHPRPSATTDVDPNDPAKTVPAPYNAANSGASNAAPTSKAYVDATRTLIEQLRTENPDAKGPVPVDLVTASGSGLDPDISPAAAEYQLPRVAAVRGIPAPQLRQLLRQSVQGRDLGILGEPRVNVLKLNLALDERWPMRK